MATFLPGSGQYLDPLGAALGRTIGQGVGGLVDYYAQQRDAEALQQWLAQGQTAYNPTGSPNEMMSPGMANFGPDARNQSPQGGMGPMPTFLSAQGRQLGQALRMGQIQNMMPLGPLQQAELAKTRAETQYIQRRPGRTVSVPEQLHEYALSLGHAPGTIPYDRITKGTESVKDTVEEIRHKAALAAGHKLGTPGYARFIKGETGDMTRAEKLATATVLRKEFNAAQVNKDFATIQRNEAGMKHALSLSMRPGFSRVASDQALAVQFQKILDPASVVRESEYARTPEGVAVLNRLEGAVDKLQRGGLAMTDSDRKAMVEMAEKLLEEAKMSMNRHIERYSHLADDYGVEGKLIFGNIKPFDVKKPDPLGIR